MAFALLPPAERTSLFVAEQPMSERKPLPVAMRSTATPAEQTALVQRQPRFLPEVQTQGSTEHPGAGEAPVWVTSRGAKWINGLVGCEHPEAGVPVRELAGVSSLSEDDKFC